MFSRITFRQPVFIGGAGNISFNGVSTTLQENEEESEGLSERESQKSSNLTQTKTPIQSDDSSTALPILQKTPGFRGCIRSLIINDRTYRFGKEPIGDAIQGFDIGSFEKKYLYIPNIVLLHLS